MTNFATNFNPSSSSTPSAEDAPSPAPAPVEPAQQGQTAVAPPPPAPSTSTTPDKAPTPPTPRMLDQYKVLLHNDDVNEMLFVVRAVCEIAKHPTPTALRITLEAHKSGLALVTITHQELAELYREQFQSKGLTATIEKA